MKTVWLEDMSWSDVEEALRAGVDTVIVCAASNEQHGPHLAENTDYEIGRAVYQSAAEKLGNTLVAPIIRPGLSAHHMCFPGSLTLRPEVFRGLVEDYVDCYVNHGFKNIVLVSSHGGNFATMAALAQELDAKYPDNNIVSGLSLDDFLEVFKETERIFGLPAGACGGHACCLETAIMLHIRPDCVRMDRAQAGCMDGGSQNEQAQKLFKYGMKGISEIGVMGDPTPATAEMGKACLDMLATRVCESVRAALSAK